VARATAREISFADVELTRQGARLEPVPTVNPKQLSIACESVADRGLRLGRASTLDPRPRRRLGAAFIRRIRAMGIRDRPVSALSPSERVIGSIRRECLDHIVVVGERHLRHVLAPEVLDAVKILKPETIIRWHRAGPRLVALEIKPARRGRPRTPDEIRQLIREMSVANPLWGLPAPRPAAGTLTSRYLIHDRDGA
jgi:hypothetical protein